MIYAVPARWQELTHPGAATASNLKALGWSIQAYAVGFMTLEILFVTIYFAVGLLIFFSRSDDRMALFMALMLVAFGVGNQTITLTVAALRPYPYGPLIFSAGGYAAWITFTQFPFLFPSGRYTSKFSVIAAVLWFVLCIPWNFMTDSPLYPPSWPPYIFGPVFAFLWGSFAFSQIHRYRHISTRIQQQQTKWVMYAMFLLVIILILITLLSIYYANNLLTIISMDEITEPNIFVFGVVIQTVATLAFLLIPISFMFSILRYRLWDIDLIIRRTMQYTLLTGLLTLIYLGMVLLLQEVFGSVSGQQSPIVLVISTLAIAALFAPLRRRIQRIIDRRFFRSKYDAQQVLAQFAKTARDEVDLERLTAALITAVQETVQPKSAYIWLKNTESKR